MRNFLLVLIAFVHLNAQDSSKDTNIPNNNTVSKVEEEQIITFDTRHKMTTIPPSIKSEADVTIEHLHLIHHVPYFLGEEAGGDRLFWVILQKYKDHPEVLIEAMLCRKKTDFIPWGNYTYTQGYDGDIAMLMLRSLIPNLPSPLVGEPKPTTMQEVFRVEPLEKRRIIYEKYKKWYKENKNNLEWFNDNRVYHSKMKNPIGGCYKLKDSILKSRGLVWYSGCF